jgi:kynurenine formamidase
MKITDLSLNITKGMPVFPSDKEVELILVKNFEKDGYNLSELSTAMHAGTHIDAPMHMSGDKRFISDFPVGIFFGEAAVLDCRGEDLISPKPVYAEALKGKSAAVICTGHYAFFNSPKKYYGDYPVISAGLCELLLSANITLLALDTPSPDREPYALHRRLSESGVFIVENLSGTLELLGQTALELFAVPLKIEAEASLVRAFAVCR